MKKELFLFLVALSATVVFADSQTSYGLPVYKVSDVVEEIDMKIPYLGVTAIPLVLTSIQVI